MRRTQETLRLHLQAGLSYNEVGRALKISKSAVGKYVSLARVAGVGVNWALAQTLIDEELGPGCTDLRCRARATSSRPTSPPSTRSCGRIDSGPSTPRFKLIVDD